MPTFVAEGQTSSGSVFPLLILLIPLVVLGWLMLAQSRRRKAVAAAQQQVTTGMQIRTTSGMYGRVTRLTSTVADVEIAPGTIVTFDRRALLPAEVDPVTGATEKQSLSETGETHA